MRPSHHRPLGLKLIIIYKFVMGTGEVLSGLALTGGGIAAFITSRFIDPMTITHTLSSHELAEDPNDLFAKWIISQSPTHLFHTALNVGLILLAIGSIKLIVAFGLLLRSKRAHALAVLFVALLTIFSTLDLLLHTTFIRGCAVGIELATLYYLLEVIPKEFEKSSARA